MNLINGFLSLFYPTQCLNCKRYIKDFKYLFICPDCFNLIKNIHFKTCKICLKPLSSDYVDTCGECCEREETYFEYIKIAGFYESPLKELIHVFKFCQKKSIYKILGDLFLNKINESFFDNIDFITFVPLSKKIKEQRNFNHTEVLAKYIGKKKGIKVIDTVKKIKETQDQSNLKKEERLKNLKDAFDIKEKIKKEIYNKELLVVDDIYTTGSTLNEISKVLKKNGAKKVFGLVAARAL